MQLRANPIKYVTAGLRGPDGALRRRKGQADDAKAHILGLTTLCGGILVLMWIGVVLLLRARGMTPPAQVGAAALAVAASLALLLFLWQAIAALREAARLRVERQRRRAFLAELGHDLRTPLGAIQGFAEIIAEARFGPVGSPQYCAYARDIATASRHLLDLSNDILDLSKVDLGMVTLKLRPLALRPLIETALDMVFGHDGRRGQVSLQVANDAHEILADERALRQMLVNLLGNARKYGDPQGEIAVEVDRGPQGGIRILVRNQGPAIPETTMVSLEEPFTAAGPEECYRPRDLGAGIGLTLVSRLMSLHRGRIRIERLAGYGPMVVLLFPPL